MALARLSIFVDAVSMAWRLAGDQDTERDIASVDRLMRLTRGDLDPLPCTHDEVVMLDLHGQLALKHKEELPRPLVVMARFTGARRHPLFNDVELRSANKEPPIALIAPEIVLGVRRRDHFCWHLPTMPARLLAMQKS
jgi:hypothetical protein